MSLVAAAVSPFDGVLSGMVAVGLGIEAICTFLGLSRSCLDDNLIRLGLRAPHDRPMRQAAVTSRYKPWSVLDTMRLIAWRVAGVHVDTIAVRLDRTPGAIRGKARRLGVPAPPRASLHRVDPRTLADPTPGFGLDTVAHRPALAPVSAGCVQPTVVPVQLATVSVRLGTAAVANDRPTAVADARAEVRADVAFVPGRPATSAKARSVIPTPGQREFPLLQAVAPAPTIPGSLPAAFAAPVIASGAAPVVVSGVASLMEFPQGSSSDAARAVSGAPRAPKRRKPAPQPVPEYAWIARARCRARDRAVVEALSLFYFGRQSYQVTAALVGMSAGALASLYCRIGLPRDRDRRKFGPSYDPALARANLAASGYRLFVDGRTQNLFWAHKDDRGAQRFNRESRRLLFGPSTDWERYQVQEITL